MSPVLKLLTAPATNDRSPRYMERALAAIHQAHQLSEPIVFRYGTLAGQVGLFVECPDSLEELVTGPIAANYPNCTLAPIEKLDEPTAGWNAWTAALRLSPEILPILRHGQFEDLLNGTFADPVSAILRAIKPEEGICCSVEIHLRPSSRRRKRVAEQAIRLLDREFFRRHYRLAEFYADHVTRRGGSFLSRILGLLARRSPHSLRTTLDTSASRLHDREEDLQAASVKIGGHLFETHILLRVHTPPASDAKARDRLHQLSGAFGAFTQSRLARFHLHMVRRGAVGPGRGQGSLLCHEEIATLFHPPTTTAAAEQMQMMEFRELEPPPAFLSGTEADSITLGRVRFRGDSRTIGMDSDARRRHVYIVGSTGAGKSTLLLNLMQEDMRAGRGLTVLDVHGDLAAAAIERVPKHRTNDAIIFDAAADHVVGFNPLACPDPMRIDQVTSGVLSAFKKLNDSWGPRLENLIRCAIFVAVEQQGTLLDMLRLLTEKTYRETVVARVADEVVRSFWQNEFAAWNAQYRTEAISSVTNKLMPFLTGRQLRAIVTASTTRSLDLRHVMDKQQILIVNLSRGKLGQDNSTLLGSLLLTAIEQAAMTRAELPERERLDHFLYLDEFQSLTTPSTAIMLSESRKYRLCLTLSHQLTRQLDPATYHAVLGNCGTILSFRVGLEDAELLAPAMSKHPGQLLPADLCSLPNYTVFTRLLIDGHPSRPFSLQTLPPDVLGVDGSRAEVVRRTSQHRHGTLVPRLVQPEQDRHVAA